MTLASGAAVRQDPEPSFPEGPGKDTFLSVCSLCHSPSTVLTKQWTEKQWDQKIIEMLQEEPDVTSKERDEILAYLSANFKPATRININRATAKELETALGLPAAIAEVIVRYRTEKGSFKTLEDLKRVPGIHVGRIECLKARIEF